MRKEWGAYDCLPDGQQISDGCRVGAGERVEHAAQNKDEVLLDADQR